MIIYIFLTVSVLFAKVIVYHLNEEISTQHEAIEKEKHFKQLSDFYSILTTVLL